MSEKLLMRFIRLALAEAHPARVPNQLVPDSVETEKQDEGHEDINEFSGVGAIAGYTAPLGMDPDKLGRRKNASRRKKK